jgi:hypothetical protein
MSKISKSSTKVSNNFFQIILIIRHFNAEPKKGIRYTL